MALKNKVLKSIACSIAILSTVTGCSKNEIDARSRELYIQTELSYASNYLEYENYKITCWCNKKNKWLCSTGELILGVPGVLPYVIYNQQDNYGISLPRMGELLQETVGPVDRTKVDLIYLFDNMGKTEWEAWFFGPRDDFGILIPPELEDYLYTEMGL